MYAHQLQSREARDSSFNRLVTKNICSNNGTFTVVPNSGQVIAAAALAHYVVWDGKDQVTLGVRLADACKGIVWF